MKQYIRIREQLAKYSNAHGISGREGNIRDMMKADLEGLVSDISTDSMGNFLATKLGKPGLPSIMLDAHMDEIGLMVRFIDSRGFLYFVQIGGWWDPMLVGQRVLVPTNEGLLPGVIGSKPPHVMSQAERNAPLDSDNMFIDLGLKSDKEAKELGIKIGTPITMDRQMTDLRGDLVTGKAFDDRAGIVMILEAFRRTKYEGTIYIVGSTQEEVGLKGAKTAAFALDPDVAICADTTIPADHPGGNMIACPVETGKGPAFVVADGAGRGLMTNETVEKWITETSEKNKLAIQPEVGDGGTTNGTMVHLTKRGIPTAVISVGTRYIHSPVEVLSLADIDSAAELIARAMDSAAEYFSAK
jgi:putative aminopeptidase FrvX